MKLLFIGDIVGTAGLDGCCDFLRKRVYNADFVIVNGENADTHNGISDEQAERLRLSGADVITLGNHAFRQQRIYRAMDEFDYILRPANVYPQSPGHGFCEIKTPFGKIAVLCFIGQVGLDPADSPFYSADRLLEKYCGDAEYIFVDFHAEATSEKRAFGYYLDGRVTGVFGTHTHVQTADEQLLPKGTAYITDVGMTGSHDSVLGVKKEQALAKFLTKEYTPFEQSDSDVRVSGVYYDTEKRIIERFNIAI